MSPPFLRHHFEISVVFHCDCLIIVKILFTLVFLVEKLHLIEKIWYTHGPYSGKFNKCIFKRH